MTSWIGADWIPIQRKLLVGYWNSLGNWRTVLARYYPAGSLDIHDDYCHESSDGYAPEGWYEVTETHECMMRLEYPPLFWMYIEQPPSKPE